MLKHEVYVTKLSHTTFHVSILTIYCAAKLQNFGMNGSELHPKSTHTFIKRIPFILFYYRLWSLDPLWVKIRSFHKNLKLSSHKSYIPVFTQFFNVAQFYRRRVVEITFQLRGCSNHGWRFLFNFCALTSF